MFVYSVFLFFFFFLVVAGNQLGAFQMHLWTIYGFMNSAGCFSFVFVLNVLVTLTYFKGHGRVGNRNLKVVFPCFELIQRGRLSGILLFSSTLLHEDNHPSVQFIVTYLYRSSHFFGKHLLKWVGSPACITVLCRQTHKQTGRQTDRQAGRQAGRQTDR